MEESCNLQHPMFSCNTRLSKIENNHKQEKQGKLEIFKTFNIPLYSNSSITNTKITTLHPFQYTKTVKYLQIPHVQHHSCQESIDIHTYTIDSTSKRLVH